MLNAILYNKKRKVMSVEIDDNTGKIIELGEVYDPLYLPIILQHETITLESINKWLDKRRIPMNREGLKEIRDTFGPFENYRNMFALTDQYWFKRSNKDSWEKMNFFTHRYPTAVGDVQFTPWSVEKKQLKKQNPDITTNGVCRKQWVQDEVMDSYLIKAGSNQFHQEPLSEVLATITLEKLNIIPFVKYELFVNGLRICSKSKNFVDKDTEFVPAQHIFKREQKMSDSTIYSHLVKMCEKYGILDASEYIDKMILADYIIGNPDRHLGNFGFIRDVETGKLIGFAPLFDFGSAFHEFYPEKREERSRIFADQEARVFKKFRAYVSAKDLHDMEELFTVIDTYPDLTSLQKNAIKKGIKKRIKEFDIDETFRSPRSR